jgi:hypothetical protein
MQWALLAIIVVGLFLISGRYPRVAFSVLAIIIIATAVTLLLTTDKATLGRQKVPASSVVVENTLVVPAYAGSYRITGRLINQDTSTDLKEITLSVAMQDCEDQSESACQIVGQAIKRINQRVPAGQARDFTTNIYFGEPRISGIIQWKFEVTDTRN